jgi:uncharacterized hydantoinase/oxoprolinase family protein
LLFSVSCIGNVGVVANGLSFNAERCILQVKTHRGSRGMFFNRILADALVVKQIEQQKITCSCHAGAGQVI